MATLVRIATRSSTRLLLRFRLRATRVTHQSKLAILPLSFGCLCVDTVSVRLFWGCLFCPPLQRAAKGRNQTQYQPTVPVFEPVSFARINHPSLLQSNPSSPVPSVQLGPTRATFLLQLFPDQFITSIPTLTLPLNQALPHHRAHLAHTTCAAKTNDLPSITFLTI